MKSFFILGPILKNIIKLTLIYRKITAADVQPGKNKLSVSSGNGFTLINDLEKTSQELQKFIGDQTAFKGDISHQETNKAVYEQNFRHFNNAQKLLIEISNYLNPTNTHSDKNIKRNMNIRMLLGITIKLSHNILILTYIRVLECLYDAYFKIYLNKFKFFNTAVSKGFISALVILHIQVHTLSYLKLCTVTDIQGLLDGDGQNIVSGRSSVKTLKYTILESFMTESYTALAKLLLLAYKYPIYCNADIKVTPLYNPIIIAFDIIKTADVLIYNLEKVATILLDEVLILLFNDAGIKFINTKIYNTLFYSSELSENVVDCTNLILFDGERTRKDNIYLEYVDNRAYNNIFITIEYLFEVFTPISKQLIIKQILNLILFSCEKIHLKKMRYIWTFVLVRYQGVLTTSYRVEIIKYLLRIVSCLTTQNNDYYVKVCHLMIFNITWSLYKIFLKAMIPYNSMGLMFTFLDIVQSIKSRESKFCIFRDQLIFLHQLLQKIGMHDFKDEFLNELYGIYDVIVNKTYNICRLYVSTEDLGYCNCILECILDIHTGCIIFFDPDKILVHIEKLLSSKIIACFLPISNSAIDKSLKNLTFYLESSTKKGYKIEKSLKKRMAIISLQLFLMLIDLKVTLKKKESSNTNFEAIINHLLNRKFDMLEFKAFSSKLSISADSKYANVYAYNFQKYMNIIANINLTHNKQFYKSIRMLLFDVIRIRLRLPQETKNLIELPAYFLILEGGLFRRSMNDIEGNKCINETQIFHKDTGDIILFDEVIANMLPLHPVNTYELCLYTFLDVFCIIHHLILANNILVSKLEKIIIDLNAVNHQLCALDFDPLACFPEKWTIFRKLYFAIDDLSFLLLKSKKKFSFHVKSIKEQVQSIHIKLDDILLKKKCMRVTRNCSLYSSYPLKM